jgi:putative addiction module antidote
MLRVKVMAIGKAMGIVLPTEALDKLKVGNGDTLYLIEDAVGFSLAPSQQDFESQMDAADKVLKRYRNAFHELAK